MNFQGCITVYLSRFSAACIFVSVLCDFHIIADALEDVNGFFVIFSKNFLMPFTAHKFPHNPALYKADKKKSPPPQPP